MLFKMATLAALRGIDMETHLSKYFPIKGLRFNLSAIPGDLWIANEGKDLLRKTLNRDCAEEELNQK